MLPVQNSVCERPSSTLGLARELWTRTMVSNGMNRLSAGDRK